MSTFQPSSRPTFWRRAAASLIFTVSIGALLHAADPWPGWRGVNGTGVSTETSFPVSWDASSIQWKTPIPGRGHSSPIVWGDRIFLTSAIEGEQIPERLKKPGAQLGGEVVGPPAPGEVACRAAAVRKFLRPSALWRAWRDAWCLSRPT